MRSLKMLWGTGNPHTSCIILGNAVNTRDNNLFDEWEMKTRYTCQTFFCFCSQLVLGKGNNVSMLLYVPVEYNKFPLIYL